MSPEHAIRLPLPPPLLSVSLLPQHLSSIWRRAAAAAAAAAAAERRKRSQGLRKREEKLRRLRNPLETRRKTSFAQQTLSPFPGKKEKILFRFFFRRFFFCRMAEACFPVTQAGGRRRKRGPPPPLYPSLLVFSLSLSHTRHKP